ncbi:caspase family protein [Aliterella atlantica]|uniref:caspase family protein n=1 Tax=Aliterella atlantica TaxID=1827278 RepID=UPI000696E3AA|nr:caspase family protein [Aliterella atlantica]
MRFIDDPLSILKSGRAKLWMLLVGVNQYQDPQLAPLNFAVSDCEGLAEALKEATQSFPNQEVIIHCPPVTETSALAAIRTSLQRIIDEANSQDTVLFYFSGHGIVEPTTKQPFLCLAPTQTNNLQDTGLGLQELLQQLQLCGDKQLVLLDACHSGSVAHLWGGARGEALQTQLDPTHELAEVLQRCAAQSRSFCALLSCDEGQRAWEFPDLKHGVFTYYLMQGLQGKATDAKGIIEANSLYKYVYSQTQQYVDSRMRKLCLPDPHNYKQTPRVIMSMTGDLVLGLNPEAVDLIDDYEESLLEYRGKFNKAIQKEYPLSQNTRQLLQQLQQQLGLREEDIVSNEARIVAVYELKLQQYKQEVNQVVYQQYPFSHDTRQRLQQLQENIGLKNEIAKAIEAQTIEAYEQKLKQYEQASTVAIHQRYPLSEDDDKQLHKLQESLEIRAELTKAIKAQIIEAYEQKLKQYEQALIVAIHQQYPLSENAYKQLHRLQESLELKNEITKSISKQVTQAYEQKFHQYEEALVRAIQHKYPLSDDKREFIENLWRVLNLSESCSVRAYEQKLQQCEQVLTVAIHQHYPLGDRSYQQLQLQQKLGIRQEIIDIITSQVTQGYEGKLKQYERALTVSIYQQYPLNDDAYKQLQQLQQSLKLKKEIVKVITAQVTSAYEQKLQQYEAALTRAIHQQYPLGDEDRQQLQLLQESLELKNEITKLISVQVTSAYKQKLQQYEEAFTRAIHQQYFR